MKNGKKILFVLLAVLLNAIEVFRNDSSFEVWAVATNLTGLVVLGYILTQVKVSELCNVFSAIVTVLAVVACFLSKNIKEVFFATNSIGQIISGVFNAWWIIILSVYQLRKMYMEKTLFKGKVGFSFLLWLAASLWAIVGRSEAVWPIWFLGMFSIFFCTRFSQKDWEDLWTALTASSIWFFVVTEIVFMPFRPYDEVRYVGFMANPNDFAKYLAIIYLFVLVRLNMLHIAKKPILLKILYVLIGGVNLAMTFMTGCRTVWIIDIVLTIIFALGVAWKKWGVGLGKVILGSVLAFLMVIVLLFPTYFAIRYVPTIHPHPIWFSGEYSESKVHSWDPADSEKYISFSEMLKKNLGRISEMFFSVLDNSPLLLKAEAAEKEKIVVDMFDDIPGLPQSINARITYAEGYISKFNLFGNDSRNTEMYFLSSSGEPIYIWHSQNFWIQITYMFGIPVGILSFILFILLFIRSVRVFKSKDNLGINVLPMMFMVFYFIYGLMEVTWLPGYMIFALIFLVQHPQFKDSFLAEAKENAINS